MSAKMKQDVDMRSKVSAMPEFRGNDLLHEQ
jgi:hypothetical protein